MSKGTLWKDLRKAAFLVKTGVPDMLGERRGFVEMNRYLKDDRRAIGRALLAANIRADGLGRRRR